MEGIEVKITCTILVNWCLRTACSSHLCYISHKFFTLFISLTRTNLFSLFTLLHEAYWGPGRIRRQVTSKWYIPVWNEANYRSCLCSSSCRQYMNLRWSEIPFLHSLCHFFILRSFHCTVEALDFYFFIMWTYLCFYTYFIFLPLQMWQSSLKEGICQSFTVYLCSEVVRIDSPLPPILNLVLSYPLCVIYSIFLLESSISFNVAPLSSWIAEFSFFLRDIIFKCITVLLNLIRMPF